MKLNSDKAVSKTIKTYPRQAQKRINELRKLIIKTAKDIGITDLEETLKWGEPSYIAPKGSTLRIAWKEKSPDQFAMYFKCTSKLVPTFKRVFGNLFSYEKDRAIVFKIDQKIPHELTECIKVTLTYHSVKKLPKLGL